MRNLKCNLEWQMSHSDFVLISSREKDKHKLRCLAFFSIIVDFQWGKLLLI
jgi:hypothetical protein